MALGTSYSFHLLLQLCFLAATTTSDAAGAAQLQTIDCSTSGNYTATDAYAANLNQLLAETPTTTVSKNGGFFNGTVGQGAATVYGLALCSVDFSRSDCNDCLTAASSNATGLVKGCPGSVTVSAIFDQCMLRYSNRNFFGTADMDIKFSFTGDQFVPLKKSYSDNLTQGFAYLSSQAATSPERFATSATAPYALVQCTWDLPSDKCKSCIDALSANASDLFAIGVDGERKSYSCRVRYSNSSFTVVPFLAPTEPTGHHGSVDRNSSKAIVAGAVIGTVVAVGSIVIAFVICATRKPGYERAPSANAHVVLERILAGIDGPTDLPLEILRGITNDFSEERKISEGGFGVVYKGVLRNGSVAVKRITMNEAAHVLNDTQFCNEIQSLLRIINHPNVVRFLGFCANTHQRLVVHNGKIRFGHIRERLICFEYVSNRSLDKHITDELRGLEWNTRYQIIKGICNGLQYLHEAMHIIHMDLKPANIMVDDSMVPKITDFGLAMLDGTSATTADRYVTGGYCAPEYAEGGEVTIKCDMYSLGVIILELVTGRKNTPDINKVRRKWRNRLKRSAQHTPLQVNQVNKCIEIAETCMEENPERRPSISDITRRLQVESQEISSSSDDDMLTIEPLELHFALEPNKEISRVVVLTNETGNCVAFNIKTQSQLLQYCTQPNKGIVPPGSKSTVKITLQAQGMTQKFMPPTNDEFIVQSTKVVAACLTDNDVTPDMFNDAAGEVLGDEVNVKVVYEDSENQKVDPSHEPSASSVSNV